MALKLKDLKTIIIVSFIGAWLYLFAFALITEIFKPDYSGNELSLNAVQTLVKVSVNYD